MPSSAVRTFADPDDWTNRPKNIKVTSVKAELTAGNSLTVTTGAGRAIVWLPPDLLDPNQPYEIRVNTQVVSKGRQLTPDPLLLLEDLRTRGDRQHPFWAKVD